MKIIRVKSCWGCPVRRKFEGDHWCPRDLTGRSIEKHYENRTLPDWRPLKEEENAGLYE